MKKLMNLYENCRISIRLMFLGFVLIAFSSVIKSDSVNIFYTFRNTFLLLFAEGCGKLGQAIIVNMPLIFMLNLVCKKANSAYPVVLAITGYFSFLITTSLFASTSLASTAYTTTTGINSVFNLSSGTRYPLELGLITSFIVAYITRFSFVRSRHRSTLSILGFLNKDSAGFIYNIVFCSLAGIGVAYLWPYVFMYIQRLISYIGEDIMDPVRIGIYGIFDRLLSVLGLGNIIRQPFWYTSLGGSYQTVSGQSVVGDINIWNYVKDISSTYNGAGRFVTGYYIINMFLIPSLIISVYVTTSDADARHKLILPALGLGFVSFVYGNPLPFELVMLFTSPLLLVFYLLVVGITFWYLSYAGIFLGTSLTSSSSTITAMPGSFPDFIINLRNIFYINTLGKIAVVGLIGGLIMFTLSFIYIRYLAYDITKSGKTSEFSSKIIDAVGGYENIVKAGNGLFRLTITLNDLEKLDVNKIQALNIRRVSETKDGIDIECGSSAYMIQKRINWILRHEAIDNGKV